MLEIRGKKIAIVFQDPATFPNPVFRVGTQISEVIKLHQDLSTEALEMRIEELETHIRILEVRESDRVRRREDELKRAGASYDEKEQEKDKKAKEKYVQKKNRLSKKLEYLKKMMDNPPEPPKQYRDAVAMRRATKMLEMVKMPAADRIAMQYPHELSGGMRQRALIAMALSCNPSILICDEATTALDVTVQAQVLNLLNELKTEIGSSIMIITHDLGVVAETCNWVNVMYAGTTVESAATSELFERPMHPYTGGLLQAIPKLHEDKKRLDQIYGSVPNLITPPIGCRFHPRCEYATDICKTERPNLRQLRPLHFVACHHPQGDY
jgi:peptide/nickel transport system ATP-binding protein